MTAEKRSATKLCEVYMRLLPEPEEFCGIIIANIFNYLAEAGELGSGVLTAFNEIAEHIAKQAAVIFMAGISEERAAVRKHTYGLRDKPYLHKRFEVLTHTVLLIEEPPSRADLNSALNSLFLEAARKHRQRVVIAGVEAV